jgi:hypothetical protein
VLRRTCSSGGLAIDLEPLLRGLVFEPLFDDYALDAITAFRDRGTATRHATVRAAAQGAGLKHRWYSRDGDDAGLG